MLQTERIQNKPYILNFGRQLSHTSNNENDRIVYFPSLPLYIIRARISEKKGGMDRASTN